MRPSSFARGGGGFLAGVDATIVGYTFLVGDTTQIKRGARQGEDFTALSLVPSFLVDGAADPVCQRLLIGDAANFGDVSEDGQTLVIGNGTFQGNSEAGIFIDSLVAAGFPEEYLPEDLMTANFEAIVGTRVRLEQVVDAEKTARQGKQEGKNGKLYDRKNLTVKAVYEVGKGVTKTATKAQGKVAGKATKGNGKAVDISQEAAEALLAVLSAKGGVIPKAKLRMALLTALTGKSPNRDAIITYLGNDEHLDAIEGIEYDDSAISAAA